MLIGIYCVSLRVILYEFVSLRHLFLQWRVMAFRFCEESNENTLVQSVTLN